MKLIFLIVFNMVLLGKVHPVWRFVEIYSTKLRDERQKDYTRVKLIIRVRYRFFLNISLKMIRNAINPRPSINRTPGVTSFVACMDLLEMAAVALKTSFWPAI